MLNVLLNLFQHHFSISQSFDRNNVHIPIDSIVFGCEFKNIERIVILW